MKDFSLCGAQQRKSKCSFQWCEALSFNFLVSCGPSGKNFTNFDPLVQNITLTKNLEKINSGGHFLKDFSLCGAQQRKSKCSFQWCEALFFNFLMFYGPSGKNPTNFDPLVQKVTLSQNPQKLTSGSHFLQDLCAGGAQQRKSKCSAALGPPWALGPRSALCFSLLREEEIDD